MRDYGEELDEIVKSLLKIAELDDRIKEGEKRVIKKWSSWAG